MKWETSKTNGGIDQQWVADKRNHIENMNLSSNQAQIKEELSEMRKILESAPKEVNQEELDKYLENSEKETIADRMVDQMANNEIDVNGKELTEEEIYDSFVKDILGFANIPILFTVSMIATIIVAIIGFIIIK